MAAKKTLQARSRELVRQRTTYERQIDREIEKSVDDYRARMVDVFRDAPRDRRPRCIIAEGDSWFRYIIGKALIHTIDRQKRNEVLNLAAPGDEVRDMMTPNQLSRLRRELRRGPTRNRKYDLFLFSGGGNDLLGQGRFRLWLRPYNKGMSAKQTLNRKTLDPMLEYLKERYKELIGIRDTNSPKSQMYLHGYDFAGPTGKPVCGMGPWLKPGLDERRVPKPLQEPVVREFLLIFDRMLLSVAGGAKRVRVIPMQGTLSPKQWANEIHPTNTGFRILAKKFTDQVNVDFP